MYGQRNTQQVNMDRFGNPYILKTAKEVVNKKTGEVIHNNFKCYAEVDGKLLKIEISERKKELKDGGNGVWVKITKVKKQSQSRQTF